MVSINSLQEPGVQIPRPTVSTNPNHLLQGYLSDRLLDSRQDLVVGKDCAQIEEEEAATSDAAVDTPGTCQRRDQDQSSLPPFIGGDFSARFGTLMEFTPIPRSPRPLGGRGPL